jgi:predicted SAM-dependent methyltransferase
MSCLHKDVHVTMNDRLHLGCFDSPVDGWINTDITPHIWISRVPGLASVLAALGQMSANRLQRHRDGSFRKVQYVDLSKRLPYSSNRFQYVFSSHVFEHLPRPVLSRLLIEIYRVMKPGGVLRVSVPDLTLLVKLYEPEKADDFVNSVMQLDFGHAKNRHYWMYSEPTMRRMLEAAGFSNVRHCRYRDGKCVDLELLDNRPEISLFMEAEKIVN